MGRALPSSGISRNLSFLLGRFANSFSALMFPWSCPGCNVLLEYPRVVCDDCELSLKRIHTPYCARCGTQFPSHWRVKICPLCHQRKTAVTAIRSVFEYDGLVSQMIKEAKYLRKGRYLDYFGEQLFVLARSEFPSTISAIVPVPLHPIREWKRTFNQAEILAKKISQLWDLPLWRALKKETKTQPQSSLSGATRRLNLQNAFRYCGGKRRSKSVLLVDDVVTTGSTLNECARVLRSNGVKRVFAVTIARAELR